MDDKIVTVPLICKENSDNRFIKIIKWLVILLILTNLLWTSSWCVYWLSPTQTTTVSQDSDGEGVNNYIGNDGDIHSDGEADSY